MATPSISSPPYAAMDAWTIARPLDALVHALTALDALLALLVVRRITGRLLAYAWKKGAAPQ